MDKEWMGGRGEMDKVFFFFARLITTVLFNRWKGLFDFQF
jgi:hypothetical protein